ncbi:helix-turn-helix domain-containing protein [Nonomuraea sp. NPDC049421]|uniref:winged helix-turn-helix transcriptional regulator n=1 Tax=Nonomuraea sp. NPDC049421 TaxID=3155275 RepID=UPI0034260C80
MLGHLAVGGVRDLLALLGQLDAGGAAVALIAYAGHDAAPLDPLCPTRRLLDRVGAKWASMSVKVLAEAAPGELRFAELRRRIPSISQKMLSVTLQSLVRDGLAERRVEPTVPPAVHYRLTDLGLSLEGPLAVLREWAETHTAQIDRNNRLADEIGHA